MLNALHSQQALNPALSSAGGYLWRGFYARARNARTADGTAGKSRQAELLKFTSFFLGRDAGVGVGAGAGRCWISLLLLVNLYREAAYEPVAVQGYQGAGPLGFAPASSTRLGEGYRNIDPLFPTSCATDRNGSLPHRRLPELIGTYLPATLTM